MARRPLALLLALLSLVVLVAATACSSSSGSKTPTTSASASASASSSAASSPSASAAAYPITVTDLLGRKVEIKQKPTTVVALSPTAVEFVYAAGGTVVGRTDTATYPDAAQKATVIGSAYQPALDKVLALKPDLVVADSVIDAQPQLKDAISNLGVPVIFAGVDSYQKVIDGLNLMGQVFDSKATTDAVVAQVTKARDDAKAAIASKGLSAVALIMDQDQTIYAAKDDSYAGDILKQ
ncbi:MAG TPA: ABC transporter substrate-binding protein, partial [Terriglobia bacterium]|nr:ABC transporter substrate-binding protein [Terriglobia bacterium]